MIKHPLSFFVDKIERGEPFSSLLYGDGEWNVITGRVPLGTPYTQYREVVTEKMQKELRESLETKGDNIYRGSDPHLLNWRTYQGTDVDMVRSCSEPIQDYLRGLEEHTYGVQVPKPIEWYDGTMWDEAVRNGELGPFLKAIKNDYRNACLVAPSSHHFEFGRNNPRNHLCGIFFGHVMVRKEDAYSEIDKLEQSMKEFVRHRVYCYCMGIGALPLIMRMRKHFPDSIHIDLGSVLDVFVGLGAERGWRREMYANPDKLKECIDKNLQGVL